MAVKKQKTEEEHKTNQGNVFRNIILGSQDGVVNVLGIVLGVATATNNSSIVLLAGLAATFAESISMGAVAYTSSKAEVEHYLAEVERERREIEEVPELERAEIEEIYVGKGFSGKLLKDTVDRICSDKKIWLETMMREELKLENPKDRMSPLKQAIVVCASSFIGSFVPLTPFFFLPVGNASALALLASLIVLFGVGAYKSQHTSGKWMRGGLEMMIIGGAAALAGYFVGVFFQPNPLR